MKTQFQKLRELINEGLETNSVFKKTDPEKHYIVQNILRSVLEDMDKIELENDPKNLIGKWGFFWDHNNSNYIIYNKLDSVCDCGKECLEKYIPENLCGYQYFSLTPPEHCK